MSVQKQNDVIQDITEQSLLTLDGVAEEITKQTVQEEVDNFIAERTLKENSAEVIAIANKVKEYKKGDKTNFGVVVEVTPSSITFKAKDTPKTKIVFNQRKMGSKDYILSSLSKLNESMEDMRSLDDIEPMEAEDMENMEVEEETIESLAAKLELTDEQVETLAAKSNEKYEEEGDAKLLDMLKMVAMPTDEEHKSAMMELIVNGDFDALEQHIDEVMKKDDDESEMKEEAAYLDKLKKLNPGWDPKDSKGDFQNEYDPDDEEDAKDHADYLKSADKFLDDISSFKPGVKIGDWVEIYIKNSPVKSKIGIGKIIAETTMKGHDYGYMGYKGPSTIPAWQVKAFVEDVNGDYEDKQPNDYVMFNGKTYMNIGSGMFYIQHEENQKDKFEKLSQQNLKVVTINEESEMKEAKRNFKKLTKDEFIKRIKKESVNENDDEDEEELSQEEEEAWKASDTLSDHFTYDSSEMPIKDFKYYAYKFVHIMDDGNRSLDTFKSMSDEKLVAEVEDMLGLGLEFDESPKYGARVIIDEQSEMKIDTTDIDELVSSEEGLTEGFKEKASIIFEAAVASKVKETKSLLKEQYATQLNEEVEVIKETLVEKIDSYLTYAVETWVNDNKVAVESTLRTEITESFIGSLKNIFTEHYIEVPESKVNVVADMEQQLSALKEQVATKGRIANALADRVEKLTRQKVIAEASAGLADTQIAKLTEMVEDVEFINEDTFTKKVSTIREFYVNRRAANDKNTLNENVDDNASFISKETIVENQIEGDTISPSMQNYLSAMSRMNKATTANLVS